MTPIEKKEELSTKSGNQNETSFLNYASLPTTQKAKGVSLKGVVRLHLAGSSTNIRRRANRTDLDDRAGDPTDCMV